MQTGTLTARDLALGDLEDELATTRNVLERVPDEHFEWRPHEKSWTLGRLATHIADLLRFQLSMVETDDLDLATMPRDDSPPATTAELLRRFDAGVEALRAALETLTEEAFSTPWTLRIGEKVVLRHPRARMLRSMGISHIVHHRAQLTIYLRLLDVPVPGCYGPSADETIG